MNVKLRNILMLLFWTLSGFIMYPCLYTGFFYATNSIKGIGVNNPDGKIFVPLGCFLLAFIVLHYMLSLIVTKLVIKPSKTAFLLTFFLGTVSGLIIYAVISLCRG